MSCWTSCWFSAVQTFAMFHNKFPINTLYCIHRGCYFLNMRSNWARFQSNSIVLSVNALYSHTSVRNSKLPNLVSENGHIFVLFLKRIQVKSSTHISSGYWQDSMVNVCQLKIISNQYLSPGTNRANYSKSVNGGNGKSKEKHKEGTSGCQSFCFRGSFSSTGVYDR